MLALALVARVVIGDPFPATSLPTLDGETVAVPTAGRVVVVELFATWCGPCHESLPQLEALRDKLGDRVTFVIIDEDTDRGAAAKVARFAAELRLPAPILLDALHTLYDRLVVRKLPTTYVIDRDGVVRHINNGFGPGYEARVAGWIEETLRAAPGTPITPRRGPSQRAPAPASPPADGP